MTEITKHIKTYFQAVFLWCGYVICDPSMTEQEMSFRVCCDRAQTVLRFGQKYTLLKDEPSYVHCPVYIDTTQKITQMKQLAIILLCVACLFSFCFCFRI